MHTTTVLDYHKQDSQLRVRKLLLCAQHNQDCIFGVSHSRRRNAGGGQSEWGAYDTEENCPDLPFCCTDFGAQYHWLRNG